MVQTNRTVAESLAGTPQPLFTGYAPSPIIAKRNPTPGDRGYPFGQVWINKTTANEFTLTKVAAGIATWISNLSFAKYVVGIPGNFSTIQAAIDQAVLDGAASATPAIIYIQPGIYRENITLFDGITLYGLTSLGISTQIQIVGTISVGFTGAASLFNLFVNPSVGPALQYTDPTKTPNIQVSQCFLQAFASDCIIILMTTGTALLVLNETQTFSFTNAINSNGTAFIAANRSFISRNVTITNGGNFSTFYSSNTLTFNIGVNSVMETGWCRYTSIANATFNLTDASAILTAYDCSINSNEGAGNFCTGVAGSTINKANLVMRGTATLIQAGVVVNTFTIV